MGKSIFPLQHPPVPSLLFDLLKKAARAHRGCSTDAASDEKRPCCQWRLLECPDAARAGLLGGAVPVRHEDLGCWRGRR